MLFDCLASFFFLLLSLKMPVFWSVSDESNRTTQGEKDYNFFRPTGIEFLQVDNSLPIDVIFWSPFFPVSSSTWGVRLSTQCLWIRSENLTGVSTFSSIRQGLWKKSPKSRKKEEERKKNERKGNDSLGFIPISRLKCAKSTSARIILPFPRMQPHNCHIYTCIKKP